MTFSKTGFVYRVAYGLDKNKPDSTNVCKLFWWFWLCLLLVWPVAYLMKALAACCGWNLIIVAKEGEPDAKWIDVWPRIKGVPIVPVMIIVPVLLVCLGFAYPSFGVLLLKFIGLGLAASIVVICLISLYAFFRKSETSELCLAWLAAKKAKVCPIVEFKEKEDDSCSVGNNEST